MTSKAVRRAMPGQGVAAAAAGSSLATGAVKGFRFRGTGKIVAWCEDMETISPYLAAMARKVKDPGGSSVEVDESGYVLVDDSSYNPNAKVIGALVNTLKRKRLDVEELGAEDLLEYLKCADFHQLTGNFHHEVCTMFWAKLRRQAVQPESKEAVLQFRQIKFTEPMVMDDLTIQDRALEELSLTNVSITRDVFFKNVTVLDSNLSMGVGGTLRWSKAVFKNSKFMTVCKKAVLEGCTMQECTWDAPAGLPERLTIKNGELVATRLPRARSLLLETVTLIGNVLQQLLSPTIQAKGSSTGTLPGGVSAADSLKLRDASIISASVLWREGVIIEGRTYLQDCRFRKDQAGQWVSGSIMARGCVFRGLTFDFEVAHSFKSCTFYRCKFQAKDSDSGHCVVFDNCTFVACTTSRSSWSGSLNSSDFVMNFHTPCQVFADVSELPASFPSSHLEWVSVQ